MCPWYGSYHGISYLIEPAIKSVEEIESLKIIDPLKDGNLPVSSNSLIGPKQFREFSLPALKKNINRIKEKTGSSPAIHICGKSKDVWEDIVNAGTKEDIFNSVKECIRKGHDSKKGYILSTGCQIPMNTPIEKVEMFMEAGRTYGKYPLK